jgi:type II secretory pathway predicted ATPase ExeA
MKQHERYSRDLKRLLNLELERNNRVRVVLTAYEELAEGEKALFRLAAEIGQDRAGQDRTGQDRTGQDRCNHRTQATVNQRRE